MRREDEDRYRGLYQKYLVRRMNDPSGKHDQCPYFVLDALHDKHSRVALEAYAKACEEEFPYLAQDLRNLLHNTEVRANE